MSWWDLDLTFDLAVVNTSDLDLKIIFRPYLGNRKDYQAIKTLRGRKLILGCRCAKS